MPLLSGLWRSGLVMSRLFVEMKNPTLNGDTSVQSFNAGLYVRKGYFIYSRSSTLFRLDKLTYHNRF